MDDAREVRAQSRHRRFHRAALLAGMSIGIALLHAAAPAGPHSWHWVHILLDRAYYGPVLLAAAWFGWPGLAGVAFATTCFSAWHLLVDWRGQAMTQANLLGDIASLWSVGILAAALFSRLRKALRETESAHRETLSALAGSLDLREHGTAEHSRRVVASALRLAHGLGITDVRTLDDLATGALLHDIGKIGLPDRLLFKPSALDAAEREEVARHPEMGASLIGAVPSLEGARRLVLAHHEWFDGTGYPNGLAGESIPLGARIFAVADVYDALTSARPYKDAMSHESAAAIIAAGRGTQFDPGVVDAFLRVPAGEWALHRDERMER